MPPTVMPAGCSRPRAWLPPPCARSCPPLSPSQLVLPALIVVLIATALGMPIFAAMGGAALLLFWGDGTPVNAVPGEAYRLTTSPMLPAIPLFALGGYILAEGTPASVSCGSSPRSSDGCQAVSRLS